MDVNEKIVNCWLQSCRGIFTITEIEYDNYHSAIDILGIDLIKKEVLDIEVKFKARIKIDESEKKQNGYLHIKKQLFDINREKTIKELLPINHGYVIKKVFITTKRFLTVEKYDYWINKINNDGIKIIFFEEIMKELADKAENLNKANDEILQTLRVAYQFRDK